MTQSFQRGIGRPILLALLIAAMVIPAAARQRPLFTPALAFADVSIFDLIDSPPSVLVGNQITYTIKVKNNGPSTATGVLVTDILPPSVTFVSATSTLGTCTGITIVTCALGGMAASQNSYDEIVTIVVTSTVQGTITNAVYITSDQIDPVPTNNSREVNPTPTTDFSFVSTPASRTVGQGASQAFSLYLGSLRGFDSSVTLSVQSGLPAGATATISAPSVTLATNSTANSILTIAAAPSTPTGTYPLVLRASGGGATHDINLAFIVAQMFTLTITNPQANSPVPGIPELARIRSLNVPGIDCGATCTVTFLNGTVVALYVSPEADRYFQGWTGDQDCVDRIVIMSANRQCTANFVFPTIITPGGLYNFTGAFGTSVPIGESLVNVSYPPVPNPSLTDPMTMTVSIAPPFFIDGPTSFVIPPGGTLNADAAHLDAPMRIRFTPTDASTVSRTLTFSFSGAAAISTLSTNQFPTTFALNMNAVSVSDARPLLSVALAGNGRVQQTLPAALSGTGLDCPAGTCAKHYDSGTPVTLTATAAGGSVFTGWSGACGGTGSCQVTMDAAKAVTAMFAQAFNLTVTAQGSGSGSVSCSGTGVASNCSGAIASGTQVTLTPNVNTGSTFSGWSGACSGAGGCLVTMDAAKSVTATFSIQTFAVNVAKIGTGNGSVTCSGTNVATDCSGQIPYGTVVTLTATPATGEAFAGWSGSGCIGTASCQITMTGNKIVRAIFRVLPVKRLPPTRTPPPIRQ